jgi:hypothetical protein
MASKLAETLFKQIAPVGALENQAAMQYAQTMQQAEKQHALGPIIIRKYYVYVRLPIS